MKQKNITFIFLVWLLSVAVAGAQPLKTLIGDPVENSEQNYFSFAGFDNANFYLIEFHNEKKNLTADITAYDRASLKRVFAKPLVVPEFNGDKFSLQEIHFAEDRIIIFYSFYSKKDNVQQLMATYYSLDGTPSGIAKEIMTAQGRSKRKSGIFRVRLSDNRKYFFILNHSTSNYGEDVIEDNYTVKITDANLKTLYEKDTDIEHGGETFKRVTVDDNGNVYIFASKWKNQFSLPEELVRVISLKTKQSKDIQLERKNDIYEISEADFYEDEKGNTYLAGFYTTKETSKISPGFYFLQFDAESGTIKKDAAVPYTMDDSKKGNDKPKKKIWRSYYGIKGLKFRDDHIAMLTSKNYSEYGGTVRSSEGMFLTTFDYNFKQLSETFAYKELNAKKEKEVEYVFDAPAFSNTESYLLFNDLPENLRKSNSEFKTTKVFTEGAVAQFVKFDEKGKAMKQTLFGESGGSSRLIVPGQYLVMDNNETIILTKSGDTYKFCKVFPDDKKGGK